MPSTFQFNKQDFGDIINVKREFETKTPWYKISLVLTETEAQSLLKMVKSENGVLLYRATVDGFNASAFHEKCDGKANTVTIIKSNFNYVFGGYTAVEWASSNGTEWCTDPTAYIFSLRRNGQSVSFKLQHKNNGERAIANSMRRGPIFGGGHDICVEDKSDINVGSYCYYSHSYKLPEGFTIQNENEKNFLAGSYNNWLATEIEVYQIFF